MVSKIDDTKPVQGNPTTESVRINFAFAKAEIEALQASVANPNIAAGNSITMANTASIKAQAAGGATTVTITAEAPSVQIDCAAGSAVILTDDSQLALGTLGDVTITPDGTNIQVEGDGDLVLAGDGDLVRSGDGVIKLNDDKKLVMGSDDDASLSFNAQTQKASLVTQTSKDVASSSIEVKTGIGNSKTQTTPSGGITIASGNTSTLEDIQGGNSGPVELASGTTLAGAGTSGDSGSVSIRSGSSGRQSGGVNIRSGEAETDSGSVTVQSGASTTTSSGAIGVGSGGAKEVSGEVAIASGTSSTKSSGMIRLASGTGKQGSGQVSIVTGDCEDGQSGGVTISSGHSTNGAPGPVKLTNGANSGHVTITSDGDAEVQSNNWSVNTSGVGTFVRVEGPATKIMTFSAATSTPPTQSEIDTAVGNGAAACGDGFSFKLKNTNGGQQWIIYSDGTQWLYGSMLMVAPSSS